MARKTLQLIEPLIGHHETIREIVLRSPTLSEYGRLGDPDSWIALGDDKFYRVENDPAIAAYIDTCVVEPKDKLLLEQLSLADQIGLKRALIDFFDEARQARASLTSPTP